MKIAHISDVHLGELAGPIISGVNARMMDTARCMNFAAEQAKQQDVDLILIPGDLFHKSKLWADEMLNEITIASNWLRNLAAIAPTVLMFGTANHDNLKAFENIKKMGIPRLFVITEPQLLDVCTKNGLVQIAAVPGVDKGYFREKFHGMGAEDENKAISEALGNVIVGLGLQAKSNTPLVLMSHYTVTGCTLENGEQMFMNADLIIPTAALQASNYDLVCLGHIHKAQSVPNCGRPTYYSGPLNGITFSEEGQDKGFWIHDFDNDSMQLNSTFINTPYREFKTIEWNEADILEFIDGGLASLGWIITDDILGKIVRVIYSCDSETNKQFNRKTLEKQLYEAGAFYVSEIRPSKIITTTDKEAMSENDTVEENLKLWLKKEGLTDEEIKEILELAAPLIMEVTATLPTGKLVGIFEPVSLDVKNYRSYREESFDFTKVKFATVNGPNGIGKSSFFMDAVADCLYEETREGELTGWISNSDDVRSGAITFTFKIGETPWRVIRTRTKSGKATLALQKYCKDEWKDESCSKKDQTQEKILNILGMDSLTFKSCALIMQDNYGAFLEADKTDRMSVLSNILGLNIYEKLQDLAKNKAREINREVEKLKAEIAVLDEKSKDTKANEEQLKELEESKALEKKILEDKESNLKELREKVVKFKSITDKLTNLAENLAITNTEMRKRIVEKEKLTTDIENAQKIISDENLINSKVAEYEKTKEIITGIKAKENIYSQKVDEKSNLATEIETLKIDIAKAQKIVDKKDTINSKIKEYEDTKEKIATIKVKEPIYQQKLNEVRMIDGEAENLLKQERDFIEQIKNIESQIKDEDVLREEVSAINQTKNELEVMDQNKTIHEDENEKLSQLSQKIFLLKKDIKSKKDKIQLNLDNCREKAVLIEDSKCPIDNPSCNFLKDALESKNKIDGLEKELRDIDNSEIDKLNQDYSTIEAEIKNIGYDENAHKNSQSRMEELKQSEEKLKAIEHKKPLLENLRTQKLTVNERIGKSYSKKEALQKEVSELEISINEMEALNANMPTLEHWYKGKDELPKAEQTLEGSEEKLKTLKEKEEKFKSEITELEKEQKQLEEFSITLALLEPYIKKKEEIPAAKQLIITSNERMNVICDETSVMEKEKIQLEAEKNKLQDEEKSLYVPGNAIEDEEKIIQVIRNKLSDLDMKIGKCQVQIESVEKDEADRSEKNKKLSAKAKLHNQYEVLGKGFSIDGVPFQIVRSVVPELGAQANEILSQMTGGKMAIEMKTDKVLKNKKEVNALEIWISDYQRGTMPYLSRSGGQKVKAALSVAFALADIKAKRNGIQLGLLFIDEPPYLDQEGAQAYCTALELISQRYSTIRVIAISHDPEMKARFHQIIEVIDTGETGSKIVFNG